MPRPRLAMRKIRDVLRLALGEGLSPPPGRPGAGHPLHHGRRPPPPGRGGRAGLAAARGPRRRRPRGVAVPAGRPRRPTPVRCPTSTSTGSCAAGRDPHAAVARIPPDPSRRLRLQPVLRPLPAFAPPPRRRHAPGAPRRREALRRLPRPASPHLRRRTGAVAFEAELFVAVLGASNYLYAEAVCAPRSSLPLGDSPRARLRVPRGRPRDRGVRQPPLGGDQGPSLRARRERHLRRDGRPLRGGRHPDPSHEAPRQGQGREPGCCWPSAGSWPGCATGASTPWPRPTWPSESCVEADQRPAVQEDGRRRDGASSSNSTARPCGPARPSATSSPPGGSARRSTSTTTSKSRLRHYYSVPYHLVGEVVDVRARRRHRRGLPPAPPRRLAPAATSSRAHHRPGPHARVPPPPRPVDAGAHRRLGGEDRARHRRARQAILDARPHPEQGYPLVPRHHPPGRPLRRRPSRGRLRPGAGGRGPLLRGVESILRHGLDAQPLPERPPAPHPRHHNLRGAGYYR